MVVVAILSLPLVFLLVRRPVLRRLAIRNAVRRPRETLLVLLGSLLGTAIITGSFVVGDTLDASLRRGAATRLGPIDEVIRHPDLAGRRSSAAALAPLAEGDDAIDGVLELSAVQAAVAAGAGQERRAEPAANLLEVDFDDARSFGGDTAATGIEGPTPGEGEVVLGRDLAETLEVGPGDHVAAFAYGTRLELRVDRVLPRHGVAGFSLSPFGSEAPNLFVAPGTIATLPRPPGASPPEHLVAVSNRGGVYEGAAAAPAAEAAVSEALGGRPPGLRAVKQDVLDVAEEVGGEFTELFSSIGSFAVLAGLLLLVNIFVMLAQERRSELGMLRAVGLRRSGLVGSFSIEGWLYAIVASLLGAGAGIGLGRLISLAAARIFGAGEESLELTFAVEAASVELGFAIGFVMSLATVVLTSVWIARVNVIRAIRDLPEPVRPRPRRRSVVAGLVAVLSGAALTAAGLGGDQQGALVGPVLAVAGMAAVLVHVLPRRGVVSAAGAVSIMWAASAFAVLPDVYEEVAIPVFVVQGVVLTGAAVALVSQNQEMIGHAVRATARGGSSLALRLGLAYPLARRFRTGMILSMYSLVVFTLTFITVLGELFGSQVERFTDDVSGGFDLRVLSNPANPVSAEEVAGRADVERVAELVTVDAEFALLPGRPAAPLEDASPGTGYESWPVTGIDESYVEGGPVSLNERGGYPSDEAAYRAVLADPSLVIVSDFFLQGGGGPPEASIEPGDVLALRDPVSGRSRVLTVAAQAEGSFGNDAAFVARSSLSDLYGERVVTNHLVVDAAAGVDPDHVAAEIQGRHLASGADADTFRSIVADNLSMQMQFFHLMQGYLALGLVVGVAGLGVVMVRAVRERRRQVGVLRALGFESTTVRRAFVTESAFVAAEGVLIGVLLAIITSWQMVRSQVFGEDLPFVLPWGSLAVVVGGTLVASLIATAAPAQQASRIRPAVALRLTD